MDNKKKLIAEHEKLIPILREGSKDKREAEAADQAKELAEMKKQEGKTSVVKTNHFEGSDISPEEHHYEIHHDGKQVGRAMVWNKDPKSIHEAGKTGASLKDIRLSNDHQGKGIASEALKQLTQIHGSLASDSRGNVSPAGHKFFNNNGIKVDHSLNKSSEQIEFTNNGQWSLTKSNYGIKGVSYDPHVNQKRKANNTNDQVVDAGKNINVKAYTSAKQGTAKDQAEAVSRQQAKLNAKQPVKTEIDPKLKAELEAKANAPKEPKKI